MKTYAGATRERVAGTCQPQSNSCRPKKSGEMHKEADFLSIRQSCYKCGSSLNITFACFEVFKSTAVALAAASRRALSVACCDK